MNNLEETELGRLPDILASHPELILAYLFGSRAEGTAGPLSDYDVGLLLRQGSPPELRYHLGHELGQALETERVDVVLLDRAPIELAYAVISQGRLLYERDLASRVEFEAHMMSLYGDYLPFLRAMRRDILEGGGHEAGVQRYRAALRRTERTLAALRAAQGEDAS